ncbi:hypothetical protein [Polaromonas hydrogenivorans]|uniref:Tip attachment protein J domain-containing protein n=1 Tax=Polaromonas hydrogenivorans TaxID=335476 RepID=A0AAU7LWK0_9BURK
MAELLFSAPAASSGALVFGDEDAVGIPGATLKVFGLVGEIGGQVAVGGGKRSVALAAFGFVAELGGTVGVTATHAPRGLAIHGLVGELGGSVALVCKHPPAVLGIAGYIGELAGLVSLSVWVASKVLRLAGLVGELGGSSAIVYSSNTSRPDMSSIASRWQDAVAIRTGVIETYRQALRAHAPLKARWQDAAPLVAQRVSRWQDSERLQRPLTRSRYQEAGRLRSAASSSFQDSIRTRQGAASRYSEGLQLQSGQRSAWQDMHRDRRAAYVSRFQDGQRLAHGWRAPAQYAAQLPVGFGSRYQAAMRPPPGLWVRPAAPVPSDPCYTPSGALLFEEPWASAMELVFICERHGAPAPIAGVVVPILRTYVTINSITLRRVDGNLPIPTFAFSMSLDVDSWTWSWSASIPLQALALVQPGSDGAPVEVEALVNGVPYRLLAEGVASQRQFGQARIAVKGRGLAAILDAPYAAVNNHGNAAARSARQLMTDVLTVNGVGFGWSVDWGLTDWLVPGGTWANQGAYIGAILDIAQAAGGYVQPHDTDQTLRVLPRYPAAPWDWASVAPDFELPSSVVSVEGIDWQRKADYNRVYVSGTKDGVLGQVTRAGTAGNSVAPMLTHALITHAIAARQRGLAILSDTGSQARVTLTLPVLAETGLIKPGQFVRYLDGSQTRLGLVRSTSLAWSRPKLRQTIAVETHV